MSHYVHIRRSEALWADTPVTELAERLLLSLPTVYRALQGGACGGKIIAHAVGRTGLSFDTLFQVSLDPDAAVDSRGVGKPTGYRPRSAATGQKTGAITGALPTRLSDLPVDLRENLPTLEVGSDYGNNWGPVGAYVLEEHGYAILEDDSLAVIDPDLEACRSAVMKRFGKDITGKACSWFQFREDRPDLWVQLGLD